MRQSYLCALEEFCSCQVCASFGTPSYPSCKPMRRANQFSYIFRQLLFWLSQSSWSAPIFTCSLSLLDSILYCQCFSSVRWWRSKPCRWSQLWGKRGNTSKCCPYFPSFYSISFFSKNGCINFQRARKMISKSLNNSRTSSLITTTGSSFSCKQFRHFSSYSTFTKTSLPGKFSNKEQNRLWKKYPSAAAVHQPNQLTIS